MTHVLKTWPEFFAKVMSGEKTFEIRKNDRDFQEGDTLHLKEWDPVTQRASGRVIARDITYVMRGGQFGIEVGYCVLGIK